MFRTVITFSKINQAAVINGIVRDPVNAPGRRRALGYGRFG